MLTFGSLFSGIGGFDLGFERAGMRCPWQCEIDSAARSILKRHFPGPALYTDVTKLSRPAAVDVLCGGFPCQDLSVAGRRAGLAGARSGLWHEFRRLAGELGPRVVVIENVPGLLSSNEGRDFAVLLHGLAELGYCLAWRVLDSQYDRVAQRRRRVFIVGSLGDGSCAQILFEPESLRWDTAPRREAGKDVAGTLEASFGASRGAGTSAGGITISPALRAQANHSHRADSQALVAGCLQASGKAAGSATQQDAESGLLIPFDTTQITSAGNYSRPGPGDPCHPIPAHGHAPAIAYSLRAGASNQGPGHGARAGDKDENLIPVLAHTLRAEGFDASPRDDSDCALIVSTLRSNYRNNSSATAEAAMHVQTATGVRRLTPRECERLQAFPDDWTRWTDTGKEQADGPRYKQLGNAVNVNTAEWIGRRIVDAMRESEVRP